MVTVVRLSKVLSNTIEFEVILLEFPDKSRIKISAFTLLLSGKVGK